MFLRRSFFSLFIITLLLGVIAYYVSKIPEKQMEEGRWVAHTHEVLNKISTLNAELNAIYAVDRYQNASDNIQQTINALKKLTQDNPRQQAQIEPLHQSVNNFLGSNTIPNDYENEQLKQRLHDMRVEEERLLKKREAEWQTTMMKSRILFLGGIALVYALMIFVYKVMRHDTLMREKLLELESEKTSTERSIAARMMQIVEIQQEIIYQRLSLENAMDVITKRTQQITGADGAVIEMLEGGDMVYRATSGTMAPFTNLRLKAKGSMSGLCVESGTALKCDDSETDSRVDRDACRKVGLRSMIVVPLVNNEQVIGVLKVTSARVSAFHFQEMQTLQFMAGVLSATLRDAAASEALQDTNEQLKQENIDLESDRQKWKNRADTDGMTGLKNHRYFQERLEQEFLRAKRYNNQLSLIMCDVDYFKQYNDQFGHPAGDEILKHVADILKNSARPSDCVARYGGEEFALILTQTPTEGAVRIAERLRNSIQNADWPNRKITVSMGITGLENGAENNSALIEQADKALYQSKKDGRDRVTVFSKEKALT